MVLVWIIIVSALCLWFLAAVCLALVAMSKDGKKRAEEFTKAEAGIFNYDE